MIEGILATQDTLSSISIHGRNVPAAKFQEIRTASGDKSSRQQSTTSIALNTC